MTDATQMLDLFLRNVLAFAQHSRPGNGGSWKDVATTIMAISGGNIEAAEATDEEWHTFVTELGSMAARELDHVGAAGPYSSIPKLPVDLLASSGKAAAQPA